MPKAEVANIITAVAEALDYAHQRDLLHRDVKPANILLAYPESGDQRILLADFGIARWVDDISGLTATNMTVGTVSYAAPEQLMGERLDGRADQYALAATAFHLLTGSPPFTHSNPAVVISQHLVRVPPAIGDARPELAALDPVFAKALAKDPKDRYEQLRRFRPGAGPPPRGRRRRHRRRHHPSRPRAGQRMAPSRADAPKRVLRAAFIVPAILAAFWSSRSPWRSSVPRYRAAPTTTTPPPTSPAPRPRHVPIAAAAQPPPSPSTTTTATTPSAAPVAAVVGANCSPVGSTGTTPTAPPRTARLCRARRPRSGR